MTKHRFETDRRTIHIRQLNELFPPYWDEGMYFYKPKGRFRWKRKEITRTEVRWYRSWKYNRKTQFKMKKTFDAL